MCISAKHWPDPTQQHVCVNVLHNIHSCILSSTLLTVGMAGQCRLTLQLLLSGLMHCSTCPRTVTSVSVAPSDVPVLHSNTHELGLDEIER